jgi:uncharacterized protein with NRDE domain
MCVVALALDCHPRWRLVLAGNRDEYHERASAPLAHWGDAANVIAGRDLVAGGSWLGVSNNGRLAVVTNIRHPQGPDPAKASRGVLVGEWLAEGRAPELAALPGYNPFNLLLIGAGAARLFSNLPAPQEQRLRPGIHGLSNGKPGENWPRRAAAEAALAAWVERDGVPDALFAMLRNERLLDDGGLPIFIKATVYGTRCSTVVLIDHEGRGMISERRFTADGHEDGTVAIEFDWRG